MTTILPRAEEYALTSQLRRAAVSIPSNIAEGSKRGTQKDFAQFLRIAMGSAAELETQLIVVQDIYPSAQTQRSFELLDEVQKMLSVLISRIATKN